MHKKNIITTGQPLQAGGNVIIMIHGRGGSAEDIISLSSHLHIKDFTIIAPQATGNSWYPYSFLAPRQQNEPWLSSALGILEEILQDLSAKKIPHQNIFFVGFSQGACLTLEFVATHASKYGGVVAFTGGLIGDKIDISRYSGDFKQTPVFIGTSNPDPHVPVERVYATANILKNMNAQVTEKIYNDMGHTINQDEINHANKLVFDSVALASRL